MQYISVPDRAVRKWKNRNQRSNSSYFVFFENAEAMRRERRQPLAVAYAGLFCDLFSNIRIRPICRFSDLLVFCIRISFLNVRISRSGISVPKLGKSKTAFEFILFHFF